jgi:hypothetical protein
LLIGTLLCPDFANAFELKVKNASIETVVTSLMPHISPHADTIVAKWALFPDLVQTYYKDSEPTHEEVQF